MENLTIISTNVAVQAQEIINGNTVDYTWSAEQGEIPQAVNYTLKRGVVGDTDFTGNVAILGAYYPEPGKFDFLNNRAEDGDSELYNAILATCKEISTPKPAGSEV